MTSKIKYIKTAIAFCLSLEAINVDSELKDPKVSLLLIIYLIFMIIHQLLIFCNSLWQIVLEVIQIKQLPTACSSTILFLSWVFGINQSKFQKEFGTKTSSSFLFIILIILPYSWSMHYPITFSIVVIYLKGPLVLDSKVLRIIQIKLDRHCISDILHKCIGYA